MTSDSKDQGKIESTRRTFMAGSAATLGVGMSEGRSSVAEFLNSEERLDPEENPRLFADKILLNGKIVTLDDDEVNENPGTIAQAMAIKGGRVVDVADNERIQKWRGPETTVIDASGKTILPGIVESHVHPSHLLRGVQVLIAPGLHVGIQGEPTPEATLEKLQSVVSDLEPEEGEWVLLDLVPHEEVSLSEQTNTWFKTADPADQEITKEDLTEMMPDNPMALGSGTGPAISDPGEIIRVHDDGTQEVLQSGGGE